MKIRDILTKEEIRALCERSDARGVLDLCVTWGLIAGAFAIAGFWPAWYTIALALVILGGRQLALAILMHEASHKALFANKKANEWAGQWLCAAPMWLGLARYRGHHIQHHAHTASDKDPDRILVRPFPTSPASLARKVARDLAGITGLKRIVGLLLMDLGVLRYSASSEVRRPEVPPTKREMLTGLIHHTGPFVLTNAVMFFLLAAAGIWWTYLLWWAAWLTTFSLFVRVRSAAEHACVAAVDDPFRNTRTVLAGPIARLTVAPHHVNYHLEHHLLMTVPHHKLPMLHRMLKERGALEGAPVARGYFEVFGELVEAHRLEAA